MIKFIRKQILIIIKEYFTIKNQIKNILMMKQGHIFNILTYERDYNKLKINLTKNKL